MLRKYVPSPEHIWLIEDVVVDRNLTYKERPEKIVDRKDQTLSPTFDSRTNYIIKISKVNLLLPIALG